MTVNAKTHMNHPSSEDWMDYVYGELDDQSRAVLDTHLAECAECRSQVQIWSETTECLDDWQLTPAIRSRGNGRVKQVLSWAVAALLLLSVGITIGRVTSPPAPDLLQLQASLEPVIRQNLHDELTAEWQQATVDMREQHRDDLRQELSTEVYELASNTVTASGAEAQRLITQFVEAYNASRTEERQALLGLLYQLESQRRTEYQVLRRDLGALADAAGGEILRTQQGLAQLISYAQNYPATIARPQGDNRVYRK